MLDQEIYIKDEHDGEEIRRAIRISTLGADFDAPLSFCPRSGESFSTEWCDWVDGRWSPFFVKHLVEVYLKARAFEGREVLERDGELAAFLDADEAERSLAGGRALLEAATEARHHRVMAKLSEKVGEDEGSGHAATVFGAHAGAFHVPLFSALVSYLYLEWRCGAGGLEDRGFELSEERFIRDAMGALGNIRELLRKHLGDFAPAACA
ncbi:MAG: urease accessory UreF family protein [Verrucomicrobiota bacterium]